MAQPPQFRSVHNEWNIECKVWVGGLGEEGTRLELEEAFERVGPVRNIWVARNPPSFAFVEMQDPRDAEDSVKELDGTELCGMLARVEMAKDKEERRQLAGERQLRLEMEKRKRRLEERREEEERKWREEERREEEERKERGRYSHRRSREKEGRSSREDGKHRCRNENTTRKKRRSRSKEDRGSSKDSKSRSKEGICDIKEYKYKRQEVEGKARDRAAEIGGTSGGNRDGKPKNQDEEVLKKKTKPKDIEFKANKKVKIDEAAAEREMEDGELEDTSDEDPYADQNKFR